MRRSTSPSKVLKPRLLIRLMMPAAVAADEASATQVNMSSFWSGCSGERVRIRVRVVRGMGMEMGTLGEIG